QQRQPRALDVQESRRSLGAWQAHGQVVAEPPLLVVPTAVDVPQFKVREVRVLLPQQRTYQVPLEPQLAPNRRRPTLVTSRSTTAVTHTSNHRYPIANMSERRRARYTGDSPSLDRPHVEDAPAPPPRPARPPHGAARPPRPAHGPSRRGRRPLP